MKKYFILLVFVLIFLFLVISVKALNVTLVNPPNRTWTNETNNTIEFEFYYIGNESNMSCELFLNNIAYGKNDTTFNDTLTILYANNTLNQGHYSWNINCSKGGFSNISSNYNLTIDRTAPYLELIEPNKGITINVSTISFVFNVSDNLDYNLSCTLFVNNYTQVGEQYNETIFVENNSLGNITLDNFSNGYYSWFVNCSDNASNINQSVLRNFTVNSEPKVEEVIIQSSITLNPGNIKLIQCNTTVSDPNGYEEIENITVMLYYNENNFDDPDNNKTHYTGNCVNYSFGGNSISYYCNFTLQYFTEPGLWYCNVSVEDQDGFTNNNYNTTTIEDLFAINVTPQYINYGNLAPGQNSTSDEVISVKNLGNREIDVTLFGYGLFEDDGLAMDCTLGNISISYEKYSLTSGQNYGQMISLTNDPVQLDDFNLKSANITFTAEKNIYWKIGVPKPKKGNCSGWVVVGGVKS